MKIRKAKLSDLDYIIDCMYKVWLVENKCNEKINPKWALRNEYKWWIAQEIVDNYYLVLIWEEKGKRVWILAWDSWNKPNFWFYKRMSNINYLFIEEEYRKKWLAEMLCEEFFKRAKKKWSDRVLLTCLDNNIPAKSLYKKMWFETHILNLGKNI